jgi:phosphoribosylformylglycinamidine synthase subunit PurSL
LAIALAKMAMGGMRGMAVSMKNIPGQVKRSDYAAFSETQGRMVATVDPKNRQQFETIMKNVPHARVGRVTDRDVILIKGIDGKAFIRTNFRTALQAYQQTFKGY